MNNLYTLLLGAVLFSACRDPIYSERMKTKTYQLTTEPSGHTLHNTAVFSPDDEWVVFDNRNQDNALAQANIIAAVRVRTGEQRVLYTTGSKSPFGPGVGAASFSPVEKKVVFIHGPREASQEQPYATTRRTAVSVSLDRPGGAEFMDARDVQFPYTRGALRGGTHAHTWSGDGTWVSFTYNDAVMEQASKAFPERKDLRTVGVMVPGAVDVPAHRESVSGTHFSVVAATVTESPAWGSDEVDKAFDEGWIGVDGYLRKDGSRQKKALAFQGNTRNEKGEIITEVFVLDLPADLKKERPGKPLTGTPDQRPFPPEGVTQRRVSYTGMGIQGPRHWLRSTPDGATIGFLAEDAQGLVQVFGISPNGGAPGQLTHQAHSVQSPFAFRGDGNYLAYVADGDVFITELKSGKPYRVTRRKGSGDSPVGAPCWSHDGRKLAYNAYVENEEGRFLQIFIVELPDLPVLR